MKKSFFLIAMVAMLMSCDSNQQSNTNHPTSHAERIYFGKYAKVTDGDVKICDKLYGAQVDTKYQDKGTIVALYPKDHAHFPVGDEIFIDSIYLYEKEIYFSRNWREPRVDTYKGE